jgi:undecaprenyl-diphosphatase
MLTGVSRDRAESFSFALAVVLTPLVNRKRSDPTGSFSTCSERNRVKLLPSFVGAVLLFGAGLVALKWLSA